MLQLHTQYNERVGIALFKSLRAAHPPQMHCRLSWIIGQVTQMPHPHPIDVHPYLVAAVLLSEKCAGPLRL